MSSRDQGGGALSTPKNEDSSPQHDSAQSEEKVALYPEVNQDEPPESRRPPDVDDVFSDDEDVDGDDPDTRTIRAVDALGNEPPEAERPETSDEDEPDLDQLAKLPSAPSQDSNRPPSSRAEAVISIRPPTISPPMNVPSIRRPESAPPPFAAQQPRSEPDWASPAPPSVDSLHSFAPHDEDSSPEFADEIPSDPRPELPTVQLGQSLADFEDESAEDDEPGAGDSLDDVFGNVQRPSFPPGRTTGSLPPPPGSTQSVRASGLPQPPRASIPPRPSIAPRTSTPPPPSAQTNNQFPNPLVASPSMPPSPMRESLPPPSMAPPPPISPTTRSGRGSFGVFVALALVLSLLGFWFYQSSRPGNLVVTVSGPGAKQLTGVRIYLDGEKVCDASPCELAELAAGTHFVKAEADGFPATADQAVVIEAGKASVQNLTMGGAASSTKLRISSGSEPLEVTIDGKPYGNTPVEVTQITPGEHIVRLSRDGFETITERITIAEGETHSIGPLSPRMLEGTLTIELGTNAAGAAVRLDDRTIEPPTTVKLSAGTAHRLTARKAGFEPFEETIVLDASRPKHQVEIELSRSDVPESPAAEEPARTPPSPGKPRGTEQKPAASSGQATLNMNSIPSSTVLLDGRPLGSTPRIGVSVPAGNHTVTFVHPEQGRRNINVVVKKGENRNVSIRF